MLSVPHEVEMKLAAFFDELAKGCRRVELARELLYRQPLFDPYDLFARLSKGKSRVSLYDLLTFIRYQQE